MPKATMIDLGSKDFLKSVFLSHPNFMHIYDKEPDYWICIVIQWTAVK